MRDQQGACITINSLQSAHDKHRAGSQRAFQQAVNVGQGAPRLALLEWANCHLLTLLHGWEHIYCIKIVARKKIKKLLIAHWNLT